MPSLPDSQAMKTQEPALKSLVSRFVHSKDAFLNRLFTPGGTADGWFEVKRNQIRVHFMNEDYVLNRENVFCYATKQADGRTWYSYGGKLNEFKGAELYDLATHIRQTLNLPRFN